MNLQYFTQKKKLSSLAILALAACIAAAAVQGPAAATNSSHRNIYGFINTPGDDESDITDVVVTDDTAGGNMDVTYTLSYVGGTNDFKWTCGYLLTNHEYHLTVTDFYGHKYRVNFYLPAAWSNDQQVATVSVG